MSLDWGLNWAAEGRLGKQRDLCSGTPLMVGQRWGYLSRSEPGIRFRTEQKGRPRAAVA